MAVYNAATLYQGTKVNTASPAELTLMLYEGAIKFCNVGLLGFETRDYEKVSNNIIKVQNIITELRATLDFKYQTAKDFDVVYTDTWVSMGDNTPLDAVRKKFNPYQVNQSLVDQSGAQIVMHCLPAHRGYEITDEVMDGSKSVVFDEAENRLHIHMAVLAKLINA